MSGATQRVTFVRMRLVGDPADLPSQHLQDWREASKGVLRTYKAWCAQQVERDSHSAVSADSQPI
jgi:hypothetical protein